MAVTTLTQRFNWRGNICPKSLEMGPMGWGVQAELKWGKEKAR